MKFLPLHPGVTRCRPAPPLTQLHNDCGCQDKCARRLAALANGEPGEDLSTRAIAGAAYVGCPFFIDAKKDCSGFRDPVKTKAWPGAR